MEKFGFEGKYLNRTQTGIIRLNNFVKIIPKKDEILFSEKTFLEIILGLIKETQNEYLTKKKLTKNKNDIKIIKGVLLKLINDLKEIKEEKEKEMKLFISKNDQKKLNLSHIVKNAISNQKKLSKSENISSNILCEDDSYNFNFDYLDIKQQNFILENKIKEVENMINRNISFIKFYKTPHRFQDHFTEIYAKNKKNITKNITENLHDSLIYIRSIWKDVAYKKNLQDMRLENIRHKIKKLKKDKEEKAISNKYISTENIIPEEIQETENIEEDKNINKDDEKDVKIGLKDMEKLFNLNMNINVNINVNKQYINNNYDNNKQNEYSRKKKKRNIKFMNKI